MRVVLSITSTNQHAYIYTIPWSRPSSKPRKEQPIIFKFLKINPEPRNPNQFRGLWNRCKRVNRGEDRAMTDLRNPGWVAEGGRALKKPILEFSISQSPMRNKGQRRDRKGEGRDKRVEECSPSYRVVRSFLFCFVFFYLGFYTPTPEK